MAIKPVSSRGYARPEMLTETGWLAVRIAKEDDIDIRVVDARSAEQYAQGHIPTAVNLPSTAVPRDNIGDMGDPGEFAELVERLGLAGNHTLIVYDGSGPAAGLVAWTLRYMGHRDTRLLDGGLQKWLAEKRPLSKQTPTYLYTLFTPRPMAELYCSLEGAKASLGQAKMVFLDVRSMSDFSTLGRIPDAINVDWTEFFDQESQTMKPAAEIVTLLKLKGVPADAKIVTYCHEDGGAAMAHFVLSIVGHGKPSTYLGSYSQWASQSDTPVER